MSKFIKIDKEKFLELFNSGMTSQQIADELGVKRELIEKRKREWNIHRSNSFYKKKLFNESFFNIIDTEEKAYWLGFMFADGNVQKRHGSYIIKIAVTDKEICDKFIKSINGNFETKIFLEKDAYHDGQKREVYHVEIYSKEMFDALCSFGCVPKKSLILKFPNLPNEMIRHFIRGYFDGDGWITIGKRNGSTKYNSITVGYIGTNEVLTGINNNIPDKCTVRKEKRRESNTYTMMKHGTKMCLKLFHYMYDNSTVYLERKYLKFKEYYNDRNINTEDVQRA